MHNILQIQRKHIKEMGTTVEWAETGGSTRKGEVQTPLFSSPPPKYMSSHFFLTLGFKLSTKNQYTYQTDDKFSMTV